MRRFANVAGPSSDRRGYPEATCIADLLARFPEPTIERLRKINEAATSSRHVIMALGFGAIDPHIGKLNHLIVKLLVRRLRAERVGDKAVIDCIENKLKELHGAIDDVTGVSLAEAGSVCASVMKPSLAK
ncbi:MAG: hypothetical protein K2W95_14775 [Candidatus Obscuribacterales bacterium]|nr:hypothetical protein [Candidatus Obscuribacterales bacterium]